MKKLNSIQFYGMPLPIYAFFAIIVLACAYFNIIPNQMIGAVAVLFAFGILIGEIGERLPIWNKFLGGGAMLCFLAAGLLKYFNLLPECVTNVSDGWINGYSFLNVFITFLVVGSLLGIDRDVLIKSGSLYIPTLLCSLLGACVFGVVAGSSSATTRSTSSPLTSCPSWAAARAPVPCLWLRSTPTPPVRTPQAT